MRILSTIRCCVLAVMSVSLGVAVVHADSNPAPPGKLVDLGGHKLHVNCVGKGNPVVVVENGLGDFSFDWLLVQSKVAAFSRICTYDRAGYAWSDPGPKPRTFAQINLELRDALTKLGEKGPYILVGHSYGGPVVRNFALTYPSEVAGVVFVDSAFEGMRVGIGGNKTMKLGEDAQGKAIPKPREDMKASDKPAIPPEAATMPKQPLDALYKVLPAAEQQMQLWAQNIPELEDAEASQRKWSSEYFANWMKKTQAGSLGKIPALVLTRSDGGYQDGLDVPAAQLEKERKDGQALLTRLSAHSKEVVINSGHNMEIEAPDEVVKVIRQMVDVVRKGGKLN